MKCKKSIRVLAMLLFSVLFLTSAYRVFFYLGESRAQEAAFGELEEVIAEAEISAAPTSPTHSNIEEPTMPAMLPGYAALYEENPDLFGWVQIEDTKLNYPVMYTPDDPEYYLRRAFDGSEAVSGVPFLDGDCPENGGNYLIYGHNMSAGTVTAHELKAGKTTSCGCRRGLSAGNYLDISGKKIGRLTALFPTDKRDGKGTVLWHCRCDCGNELDVSEDGLIHGNYRSCGCLKSEVQQNIKNQLHRIDGTCVEWLEKRKHRRDNTSGFRGVYACHGKFRAGIGFKKQRFHIGTYDTFEEAVQARLEAEALIHDGFVKAYHAWQEQGGEGPFIYEVEKVDGWFRIHTNL